MRPTKGEISVTPASAQAAACAKEKSSVMLQWMASRSRRWAARIPGRREQERGIGGGVLRLPARHRVDVAGVGDHHRVLAQGFELSRHRRQHYPTKRG